MSPEVKKIFFVLVTLIMVFATTSCSKTTTQPEHVYGDLTPDDFSYSWTGLIVNFHEYYPSMIMKTGDFELYMLEQAKKYNWSDSDYKSFRDYYLPGLLKKYPASFFNTNYLVFIPILVDEYTTKVEITHITTAGLIYINYEWEDWDFRNRASATVVMAVEIPRWFRPDNFSVSYNVSIAP